MAFKLENLFGDANAKEVDKLSLIVELANAKEEEMKALSNDGLPTKTEEFKKRLKEGATLDDILPEAFALAREAGRRTLGQRHYDVQLMGGMVLHSGKIGEMRTGEGKTLAATAPAYLNALSGEGVHVVTVNDYLAKRDTVWMGQIYSALGLTVSCVTQEGSYLYDASFSAKGGSASGGNVTIEEEDKERDTKGAFEVVADFLRPVSKKEAYAADITYGTNNEYGFDYLRDNMVLSEAEMSQRGHNFAIVDEVDSILIDEARTPLIISSPDTQASKKYEEFSRLVPRLNENTDYNLDEKTKSVLLTEEGISKVEKLLGIANLYADSDPRIVHHLEQALRAHVFYKLDRDYVVKDGEIVIVDEFTGRLMPGRRWSEGLHQAVEAKEGVRIQSESRTLATITFQNYFRMYKKLSGMTGTAVTNAEEFHKVYKLEVVVVPTAKPMVRKDQADLIYKNEEAKYNAVVEEIKERHSTGQPVLVGTVSIQKNELLSALLKRDGVPHQVLNAKNHEQEGAIIAQAGRLSGVTIATNMAGRGVDIILGGNPKVEEDAQKIRELGGLHVIGTERHEARRIDNQLRGRAGRQGDPGSSRFFVSLQDDLMRIFGGDQLGGVMQKLGVPDDMPIESKIVSKAIEGAQARIEGFNFDSRKHLLEYDDVVNKHRNAIYTRRRHTLKGTKDELTERMKELIAEEIEAIVDAHTPGDYWNDWSIEELVENVKTISPLPDNFHAELLEVAQKGKVFTEDKEEKEDKDSFTNDPQDRREAARKFVLYTIYKYLDDKIKQFGDVATDVFRFVLLRSMDGAWMDHLDAMEALRDSVSLRAYGQRDPLVEYKNEGRRLFDELMKVMRAQAVRMVFRVEPRVQVAQPANIQTVHQSGSLLDKNSHAGHNHTQPVVSGQQHVGRNDPCPCGAVNPQTGEVYKYKKCGLINAPHHRR